MARIIEGKRRLVKMSTEDVIAVVRQYQNVVKNPINYEHTIELLAKSNFYLPEDI